MSKLNLDEVLFICCGRDDSAFLLEMPDTFRDSVEIDDGTELFLRLSSFPRKELALDKLLTEPCATGDGASIDNVRE
jgi:hypothetical protein